MKYGFIALLGSLSLVSGAAQAADLVTNGGFEDGSYTVTPGGITIPNGWTANAAYQSNGYNGVTTGQQRSGTYDVEIGNFDASPVDMLSQTFSDVAGAVYDVSFYTFASRGGDPNAFLTVSAGGQSFSFNDTTAAIAYGTYVRGTFSFTGSGSDTLTIAAATNPGDWFVDDVSVTGPAVGSSTGAVPEPASWAMMLGGFGMIGGAMRSRKKAAITLA